jgi:hypothetical protein
MHAYDHAHPLLDYYRLQLIQDYIYLCINLTNRAVAAPAVRGAGPMKSGAYSISSHDI